MQLTRRDVFTVGALGALSACTSPADKTPEPVDPDVALLAAAVAREQALLLAYDDALLAHPSLAGLLAPLREEHQQHLDRLQPPSPSATPTTPTPTTPTPDASATPDLTRPAPDRAALAGLERAASTAHGAAAVTASRRLAPVLASLSASEASHLVVL